MYWLLNRIGRCGCENNFLTFFSLFFDGDGEGRRGWRAATTLSKAWQLRVQCQTPCAACGLGLWLCSQGPGTAASGATAAWAGIDERQIYSLSLCLTSFTISSIYQLCPTALHTAEICCSCNILGKKSWPGSEGQFWGICPVWIAKKVGKARQDLTGTTWLSSKWQDNEGVSAVIYYFI